MTENTKLPKIPEPPLSPSRAVSTGHLFVTLPVIAIMVAGFLIADHWRGSYWAFAPAFSGFVIAWLWWSIAVPLWRDWARRRGADEEETQTLGVRSGLVWPKGFFLEKTEIKIRKKN